MSTPTQNDNQGTYIIFFIIGCALIGILIYYIISYVKSSPQVCPQGQILDSTTKNCIPICSDNEVWNGKNCTSKCNTPGHKINPTTGSCDPWPADCSKNPIYVNSENGSLNGTILSDDKFSCINPSDLDQNVLDKICKSNECTCKTSSCKFQECKIPQPFQAFSKSENSCIVKKNCELIPSDFVNLFPYLNILCGLSKKQGPPNEYSCTDLNLEDFKQKCLNDEDGCQYGYSYDITNTCVNKDGVSMPQGDMGCRIRDTNTIFNGATCGNTPVEYVIVTDIKNVTSTMISGQLSYAKKPKQYPSLYRYLILETDNKGNVDYSGQLRFSDMSSITPASHCDIKTPSDVECLNFTINLTGNSYNKPMKVLSKYRLIILGYNDINGIQTPLTCSSSSNITDINFIGDIIIPYGK